jgi:hypothetical protein
MTYLPLLFENNLRKVLVGFAVQQHLAPSSALTFLAGSSMGGVGSQWVN